MGWPGSLLKGDDLYLILFSVEEWIRKWLSIRTKFLSVIAGKVCTWRAASLCDPGLLLFKYFWLSFKWGLKGKDRANFLLFWKWEISKPFWGSQHIISSMYRWRKVMLHNLCPLGWSRCLLKGSDLEQLFLLWKWDKSFLRESTHDLLEGINT